MQRLQPECNHLYAWTVLERYKLTFGVACLISQAIAHLYGYSVGKAVAVQMRIR